MTCFSEFTHWRIVGKLHFQSCCSRGEIVWFYLMYFEVVDQFNYYQRRIDKSFDYVTDGEMLSLTRAQRQCLAFPVFYYHYASDWDLMYLLTVASVYNIIYYTETCPRILSVQEMHQVYIHRERQWLFNTLEAKCNRW